LIAIKFLQEFPDAGFRGVDVESLLAEAEYSPFQTREPVRKGPNFRSDRLIAIQFLQEFPDAGFRGLDVESQLGEAEFSPLQTVVPVRKGDNF
jgi:hypothetical protein